MSRPKPLYRVGDLVRPIGLWPEHEDKLGITQKVVGIVVKRTPIGLKDPFWQYEIDFSIFDDTGHIWDTWYYRESDLVWGTEIGELLYAVK